MDESRPNDPSNPPPSEDSPDLVGSADGGAPRREIIERLEPFIQPGREQEAATVVQTMLVRQSHISGPLPSSLEFRGYEDALPGAANRILSMTEREQIHRQTLEGRVVSVDLRLKMWGQRLAFGALTLSLATVCFFVYLGHPTEGAAFGAAVILGVVALFLGQRWIPNKSSKSEDSED